jgi:UDP:flavonoid glycosyltransferase YjiC (YdhE family)
MRILFISLATASHYNPMVPLAWAFRAAGHEVRVAGQPPIIEPILRSGHFAVSVGASYDLLANLEKSEETFIQETGRRLGDFGHFREIPPEALKKIVEMRQTAHHRTAEAMAEDLVPFAHSWAPDLVVTDLATLVGPLVAEVVKAPVAFHSWGPQFGATQLPSIDAPAAIRELFERYGAEARTTNGLCTIDPCPPSMQAMKVPNQLVARYVPYNGSGVVPEWLRQPSSQPRVLVSWSTSNSGTVGSESPVRTIIEALVPLDVEVVVALRAADRAALGAVPDGVHVVENLPLQVAVPTCAATIHHGGGGTTLTSVAYGVPQLLLPQDQSHMLSADAIATAGAGLSLRADEVNVGSIASAVTSILTEDSWRKAAQALQDENAAQPSPAEVVRSIEELIAELDTASGA